MQYRATIPICRIVYITTEGKVIMQELKIHALIFLLLDNNLNRLHNGFIMKSLEGVYMATVTVKNIPDELYDRLKSIAKINRRSINSEIIMCIENTVISRPRNLNEVLENARQLRQLTAGHMIDDKEFNQAKAEGRP